MNFRPDWLTSLLDLIGLGDQMEAIVLGLDDDDEDNQPEE